MAEVRGPLPEMNRPDPYAPTRPVYYGSDDVRAPRDGAAILAILRSIAAVGLVISGAALGVVTLWTGVSALAGLLALAACLLILGVLLGMGDDGA